MRVFLDTVGCRLNQSEIEAMAGQFRAAGHEIVGAAGAADLAVVNTCAVTARAASDSRAAIRRSARAGAMGIVATGCWVSLQPVAASVLTGVKRVVINADKDRLVGQVLGLPEREFESEPLARRPLPGLRHRTRAFIKAQDGCDNYCTFCVTTLARGGQRSRPTASVLADIEAARRGGAQEIILTGVHLGSWGQDQGSHLRCLVRDILRETDVPRLRLSSLEPWDLDEEFFSLWEDPRLCQHLHLPLQSGCATTLKRMARRVTPRSFGNLVAAARKAMPEVAITTDVIAGFPGETEDEFQESLAFVREVGFAGGHAFAFSPRPETAASRLGNQVPPQVSHERNTIYRSLFDEQARTHREGLIGQTVHVLWEATTQLGRRGWRHEGWSENYVRVSAWAPAPRWNMIDAVELTGSSEGGLNGVLCNSG